MFLIGISTSGYSFFEPDHPSVFQNNSAYGFNRLTKARGYELSYLFKRSNGIRLSCEKTTIYYLPDRRFSKPPGWVIDRYIYLYNIEYIHPVIKSIYGRVNATIGISYRRGSEVYIVSYDRYGPFVRGKPLNDLGVSTGAIISVFVIRGLRLNMGIKYTYFAYREDTGGDSPNNEKGSSQHMLSVFGGLGYAFGFKKKIKKQN